MTVNTPTTADHDAQPATETSLAQDTDPDTQADEDAGPGVPTGWYGVLAPLETVSGDRRVIAAPTQGHDARVRPLPLSLLFQDALAAGHEGAVVVGTIDQVWVEDNQLMGEGTFDLNDPRSAEVARRVGDGFLRGISVDLDDTTTTLAIHRDGTYSPLTDADLDADLAEQDVVEMATDWRLMSATLVAQPAFAEAVIQPIWNPAPQDDGQTAVVAAVVGDTSLPFAPKDRPWSGDDAKRRILDWADGDGAKMAQGFLYRESGADPSLRSSYKLPIADVVGGRLRIVLRGVYAAAAAVNGARGGVDIPQGDLRRIRGRLTTLYRRAAQHFNDDSITPPWASSAGSMEQPGVERMVLLASGAPIAPPAAWFDNPRLTGPTSLQVTDEGQVFGHLALFGTCHTGGAPGTCQTAPRSGSGYAFFHVGAIRTAEGGELSVGTIVAATDHADLAADHARAVAHYADTGRALAAVRAGEDAHGIWVAGAVLPEVDDTGLATLRRSPLSGDWRVIGGRQELVAALCVNTPGFPIPRARSGFDGQPWSLVAAGALPAPEAGQAVLGLDVDRLAARIASYLSGVIHPDGPAPQAAPQDAGGEVGQGCARGGHQFRARAGLARGRMRRARMMAARSQVASFSGIVTGK